MEAIAKRETDKAVKPDGLAERAGKLQSLMNEANRNSKKLLDLRAYLKENPDIMEKISFLAASAKKQLVEKCVSGSGSQAVLLEELKGVARNISQEDTSPLEDLLIDCIGMCWLRVQYAEHYRSAVMGSGQPFREIELAEKLLTKAQNRFIKAIESLAKLRKLQQPKSNTDLQIRVR